MTEERIRGLHRLAQRRHEVVAAETQHAHELRRERAIEPVGDIGTRPQRPHFLEHCGRRVCTHR